MTALILFGVVAFLLVLFFRKMGRLREMERDIYHQNDLRARRQNTMEKPMPKIRVRHERPTRATA